jgi:UDP-glucose 4-epimerase
MGDESVKVLVTGSSGFIGRYVMAEVLNQHGDPAGFDRPLDVRDAAALTAKADGCGGIIHLAGMLGTEEMFGHEAAAVTVNVLGSITVMDVAARLGLPLVIIGTGHKGQPNTYAITKGCAEDLALARAQWLGEKIAVVRAYHVYGAGQPPPAPWGPGHCRKILPVFACAALTGQPIPLHGGGTQMVDMIHARLVAQVLVTALAGPYGQVTEAGTGHPITVRQVALDVMKAAGRDDPACLQPIPPRRGEPDGAAVYARDPSPVIRDGQRWPWLLEETLDWYRAYATRPAAPAPAAVNA